MAPTNIWDILQPPDSQLANLLGQDIRSLKLDIQQRMGFISGSLATRWDPATDTQPTNWTGLLYFTTDTNQIFRWNGAAWDDVSNTIASLPAVVRKQTITNQAVSSGTVILYTVPSVGDGMYRMSMDAVITTAGTGGTISMTASWNNGVTSPSSSSTPVSLTLLGGEATLSALMYVPPTRNISYAFTLNAPLGSPRFSGRARLEYLGV